jgi:hypothetical protein
VPSRGRIGRHSGNNRIFGNDASDRIRGGAGHDTLIGGEGFDASPATVDSETFAFSGTVAAAHGLWTFGIGTDLRLRGDMTGDGVADFEIQIKAINSLQVAGFLFQTLLCALAPSGPRRSAQARGAMISGRCASIHPVRAATRSAASRPTGQDHRLGP